MKPMRIVAAAAILLTVASCSSSDSEPVEEPSLPPGFVLPDGLEVTAPGSVLDVGAPATVVVDQGSGVVSAVTVTVTAVRAGDLATDFRLFSLDQASAVSTPYYVDVSVRNDGPDTLAAPQIPVYAHDASNTLLPPNEIVGQFEPCASVAPPQSFLPTAVVTQCHVYLVPEGQTLQTIDLQVGAPKDAVKWKLPGQAPEEP